MLRFQVNPTRDWGPKPRPSTKPSHDGEADLEAKIPNKDLSSKTDLTEAEIVKKRKLSEDAS